MLNWRNITKLHTLAIITHLLIYKKVKTAVTSKLAERAATYIVSRQKLLMKTQDLAQQVH